MICVDASVAVKWIVADDEERVDLAGALLENHLSRGEELIAPPLIVSEVANTLHRRLLKYPLPLEWAERALETFLSVPIVIQARESLIQDAMRIAAHFRLPAIYDAQYLALAQYVGCDLWTDDLKLIRAVRHELPFVRALSEYEPGH